jgi:hypothetical protein
MRCAHVRQEMRDGWVASCHAQGLSWQHEAPELLRRPGVAALLRKHNAYKGASARIVPLTITIVPHSSEGTSVSKVPVPVHLLPACLSYRVTGVCTYPQAPVVPDPYKKIGVLRSLFLLAHLSHVRHQCLGRSMRLVSNGA